MALGGQSRFYYPYPRAATFEQVQSNFDHVQSRYDRTPVFEPHHFQGIAGNGSTSSGTYVAFPITSIDAPSAAGMIFYKEESWTSILFHVQIQTHTTSVNYVSVYANLLFNGKSYSPGVGRTIGPDANTHTPTFGTNKINTPLPAGRYVLTLAWAVGSLTATVNSNAYWSVDVTEVLPTTKFT